MQTKSAKAIHPIGIGTWNISSISDSNNPDAPYKGTKPVYGNEEVEIEALRYSLTKGQNHLDCAEMYGAFYTDEVVGRALQGTQRSDLFIADKLWKSRVDKGLVRPTVEKMLQKLGTDYLDVLYIHKPWDDAPWQRAIPQIDKLIDEGIVRYFGVSNFTVKDMQEAQSIAKHPIAVNQMKYNVLYKDEVTDELRQYCAEHDIQIVAYQPIKRQEVLNDETVKTIATKYDATPAQVALAWLLAKGALPIPKATNKVHIDENVAAIGLRLSDEDVAALDEL